MHRDAQPRCGICDGATPMPDGSRKVWYYEPHADFYCARHWEAAFAGDCREHLDDDHWETVVRPLLELTHDSMRRAAAVSAAR
jgi:hypothetical protein